MRRLVIFCVAMSLGGITWVGTGGVSQAAVAPTVISTANYPLALDVDAAGNVWIGYVVGPDNPWEGVTVVPAATGTLFGVSVTAGVETRIFNLPGVQGIVRSPAGHLFVANESGDLYVATDDTTVVFGTPTSARTLTLLNGADLFRGGLAMDSSGNLFGARKDWGGVAVMPAATGTLYGQAFTANTPALLTPAGLPWGGWEGDLAVDSFNNLFVNTWFTNPGPQGVYVLPKTSGTLFGQSVTADTLTRSAPFNGAVSTAAGIDIDDSNNIYVSQWPSAIYALSPQTRFVMGQTLTANTVAVIAGSSGRTNQGVAVVPDGSSLISGATGNTVRLTPVPSPPVLLVAPTVNGVADVGETLTASGGTWSADPAPIITGYQWERCDQSGPAGVEWLPRASVANSGWNSVTWGGPPGGQLFAAVSSSGTGSRVMTSPDGITWTSRASAADNSWTSVTWGGPPGGELFVAVSSSGTGNRVMTSPDGITWTSRASAANNSWNSVTWGGGLFVAVSSSGTGNRVMTSPDGITWTSRTSAANSSWNSVTWGGGLFVAVSSSGTGNRVMTSPDGITWTSRVSAADNNWTAIAWGGPPSSGLFAAVSNFTTGRDVMTSSPSLTCSGISGASGSTFLVTDSDRGKLLRAQVTATNIFASFSVASSGLGPVPNPVTPQPPRIPPGPPIDVVATPTIGGALVSWTPPVDPGTDTLNLYAVRAWPGGPVCQVPASALTCSVTGLDPTVDFYFTVVAMSGAGWGNASAASNTIRPLAPRAPSAPLDVRAVAGNGSAAVSWSAPADPGTSPILDYRVESTPAGGSCVTASFSCVITGLQNGTAYTFTVEARNDQGWGPMSSASVAVTPRAPGISIQGQRSGQFVSINGTTVGIKAGTPVEVWVRLGDSGSFVRAASTVTIDAGGALSWTRRVNPDKQVAIYLLGGGVQSNSVVLARTRPR